MTIAISRLMASARAPMSSSALRLLQGRLAAIEDPLPLSRVISPARLVRRGGAARPSRVGLFTRHRVAAELDGHPEKPRGGLRAYPAEDGGAGPARPARAWTRCSIDQSWPAAGPVGSPGPRGAVDTSSARATWAVDVAACTTRSA